jgi:phosphohistidine swiveling domain-containing protein
MKTKINIVELNKIKDWTKVWSGRWSLHFDSHTGDDWTKHLKVSDRPIFEQVIYFYHQGITDCWVSSKEKDDLGKRLCSLARKNIKFIPNLCEQFKLLADEVTEFLATHDPKKITFKEWQQYWNCIQKYYLPHLSAKYMVDYLSAKELKKYLPLLEDARLYAELVFRNSEDFLEKVLSQIAKQNKYPKNVLLAASAIELDNYFKNKKLPSKAELKKRFIKSALIVKKAQQHLYVGMEVNTIEKIITFLDIKTQLLGQSAYRGKAIGKARIILNPKKVGIFEKGDILVTGMTRPDFLTLMKKSAAFVTDAGGILSHAAIVARELKKPCIIGTKFATKIFKDGDIIEVDADNGIIKKIK